MVRYAGLIAVLAFAALPASSDTSGRDSRLVGQWTFDKGDAQDSSGNRLHGVVHNVTFKEGCAHFDGKGRIEIPLHAETLRRGYRTVDVEIRARLEQPERYYTTLFSHPLFSVAVNALGSGKGRPCFTMANLASKLAPDKGGDARWGKGPALHAKTDQPFYYWGWVGDGATVIPAKTWVTLRTVYDGKSVTQWIDGKLVATHAILNPGTRVASDAPAAAPKAAIGKYLQDINAETGLIGAIDFVRIRGTK